MTRARSSASSRTPGAPTASSSGGASGTYTRFDNPLAVRITDAGRGARQLHRRDTTDMLLRNATTGAFEIYEISDNNVTNAAALGTVGLDFQLAGFGDFNHDGGTDITKTRVSSSFTTSATMPSRRHQTSARSGSISRWWVSATSTPTPPAT
jgi:hypothetical protein